MSPCWVDTDSAGQTANKKQEQLSFLGLAGRDMHQASTGQVARKKKELKLPGLFLVCQQNDRAKNSVTIKISKEVGGSN